MIAGESVRSDERRVGALHRALDIVGGSMQSDELSLDTATYDRWRRTLLVAIPFGVLAFVVGALMDAPTGQGIGYDRVAYPFMAAALAAVELLLLWRRDVLRFAVSSIVLGASTFFLGKLLVLLQFSHLPGAMIQRQMTETFFWIPVIYLLSFLVPGVRGGRIISTGFTGVFMAVSGAFVIAHGTQPIHLGITYALIEMNLANSVQLALTYAFISLKDDYLRSQFEKQVVERYALTDLLTGLPNRRVLEAAFDRILRSRPRERIAAMFIDIDGFKVINDTLGHEAGDQLLQLLGERLRAVMRDSDLVVRLSGDEFVVVAEGVDGRSSASDIAQRVFTALATPFVLNETDITVTASVGAAFYPDDAQDAATLLRHADSAMYKVKRSGKNGLRFFSPDTDATVERRGELERELRNAIKLRQFHLEYQPIVDLGTGLTAKYEALLRWNHPTMGEISPAEFVPVAEESGAIVGIGSWVLEEACRQLAAWRSDGLPDVRVSVNVSPLQFMQPTFFGTVARALQAQGVPADALELELTESVVVNRVEDVRGTLAGLRGMGVTIAIDDFGTGYSSLAYLRDLPLDAVKIDRGFVRDLGRPREAPQFALALVEAILSLAQHLDLTIIAEGVETEAQRSLLAGLGCHQAQGYLFARPMSADDVAAILRTAGRNETALVQERLIN